MATGQYLTDLALELVERGHEVTVISSDRGYDDPAKRFPSNEKWRGINIFRVRSVPPVKHKRWRRALNFGSFLLTCAFRLAVLPRVDVVVTLTSPPLISFLGALYARAKGGRLVFWVMDLNPDEAIVAGWLKESSLVARVLEFFLRYSLRNADKVIALDRFMRERLLDREIPTEKVVVVPPWVLSEEVTYDHDGRERFRRTHDLSEKFVVMYAGNHSPCHPLETVLDAANRLRARDDIMFCFVGGGSEQETVRRFAVTHSLTNVRRIPYQPLNELSGVLSAADLHLVVMGERFAGIVHPCKIYNVLAVGRPVLYIGPSESHITDIARHHLSAAISIASHSEPDLVVEQIIAAVAQKEKSCEGFSASVNESFSRKILMPKLLNALNPGETGATMRGTRSLLEES